jgi:hypothetical protein
VVGPISTGGLERQAFSRDREFGHHGRAALHEKFETEILRHDKRAAEDSRHAGSLGFEGIDPNGKIARGGELHRVARGREPFAEEIGSGIPHALERVARGLVGRSGSTGTGVGGDGRLGQSGGGENSKDGSGKMHKRGTVEERTRRSTAHAIDFVAPLPEPPLIRDSAGAIPAHGVGVPETDIWTRGTSGTTLESLSSTK